MHRMVGNRKRPGPDGNSRLVSEWRTFGPAFVDEFTVEKNPEHGMCLRVHDLNRNIGHLLGQEQRLQSNQCEEVWKPEGQADDLLQSVFAAPSQAEQHRACE